MKTWMLAAIGAVAGLSAASAQDVTADTNFGDVSLSAGFAEDPYTVDVLAGGSRSSSDLGAGC
ncbi:MAG: peptidase S1, partial [Maricaulaceae bacterium]